MADIFRFVYFVPKRSPRLHQQRDSALFIELLPLLLKEGYDYNDCILNYPIEDSDNNQQRSDIKFKNEEDLIVCLTRPPINDDTQEAKTRMYRTGCPIERHIFNFLLSKVFKVCSRNHIKIHEDLASTLPEKFKKRGDIWFRKNASADYYEWKESGDEFLFEKCPRGFKKTATYIIYIQKTDEFPAILCVFGVGGQEGLIFSRLLRKKGIWQDLEINLKNGKSRFIMIEMDTGFEYKNKCDLVFSDSNPYKIIIDSLI